MLKVKNLEILDTFIKNNSRILFINVISDEVNYFYLHYIKYLTEKNNIKLVQSLTENHQTGDLFEQKKIFYMFENIKSKIDQIKEENYKKIIFTKYSNYKNYSSKFDHINTYQYSLDIRYLLEDVFQIKNNDLYNYCLNSPHMAFEEINKYNINQLGYLVNTDSKNNMDNLADHRRSFYEKKIKKNNLQEQYDLIKHEVLLKKFNFLIY